jgi:hypothetical protein
VRHISPAPSGRARRRPAYGVAGDSVPDCLAGSGCGAADRGDTDPGRDPGEPGVAAVSPAPPAAPQELDYAFLPLVSYAPETSVAIGGTVVLFDNRVVAKDAGPRQDDEVSLSFTATWLRQFVASIEALKYWKDGRYQLSGQTAAVRFPNRFWGVGNTTPEGTADTYTQDLLGLRLNFGVLVIERLYAGLSASGGLYGVADVNPGGAVDRYLAGRKHAGHLLGGGPFLRRDTRDDFIFPRKGSLTYLNVLASRRFLSSDYDYEIYELDQRNYLALGQRTVLAFEGYARWAPGQYVPLDDLSLLGGAARLRGYFEGRYRDRGYLMSQIEARVHLVWRASLAPFFAVGDVYRSLDAITLGHLKAAGGLGLRVNLKRERAFNLRVDYAQSSTSSAIYINLGEAF